MKNILNRLIIITSTFLVLYTALTLTFLLYRSALSFQSWKTYNDSNYNFSIKYQYIKPLTEKMDASKHILKKIIIPIKSPGLFNLKEVCLSVNIIDKKYFDKHIKKDELIFLSNKFTDSGEEYSFSPTPYRYNSYFLEYDDYVFEITEPYLNHHYEDSKIHEMTLTLLLPSFKRTNNTNNKKEISRDLKLEISFLFFIYL